MHKFSVGQKVEILIGTYTTCIGIIDSICTDYGRFPYFVRMGNENSFFISQYSEEELKAVS